MRHFVQAAAISALVLGTSISYTAAWSPAVRVVHQRLVTTTTTTLRANPLSQRLSASKLDNDQDVAGSFDPLHLMSSSSFSEPQPNTAGNDSMPRAMLVGAAAVLASPGVASAASADAIPSALAAYVHYLSLLVMVASIMTERLTVQPAMSVEEEQRLAFADILLGVSATALTISGYYRATQSYGKGWDFYSHEPVFWLKMTFLGIFGALSLFPTITIIQRSVKIQQEGTIEPMSEELAQRMTSILNAELSALAFIPLTATLMARGVGYVEDVPTQIVGPVLFGIVTAGSVFKYVKDALSWDEAGLMTKQQEE
jgi:putative membrane protein